MEATALYSFHDDPKEIQQQADSDLLTLLTGDRVQVLVQEESGWWSGINLRTEKNGWFPASFVELNAASSTEETGDDEGKPCPGYPDWMEYLTDDQQVYYVHRVTGESSWSLPEKSASPPPPVIPRNNTVRDAARLQRISQYRMSFIPQPPSDIPEPIFPPTQSAKEPTIPQPSSSNNVVDSKNLQLLTDEFDAVSMGNRSRNNTSKSITESPDTVNTQNELETIASIAASKKKSSLDFFRGMRRQPSTESPSPITPPREKVAAPKSNDGKQQSAVKEQEKKKDAVKKPALKTPLPRTSSKPPLPQIKHELNVPQEPSPLEQKRRLTSVSVRSVTPPASASKPSPPLQPPQQQAKPDANGKYGYADNFWADKSPTQSGFDVLVLKHRTGKEMCKDVAQFMNERARIEEQYARAMLELSKTNLGAMELGSSKTAWNQVKFDMETQARAHLAFAEQIQRDVESPIVNFKNEQKILRKNYEATIGADRKLLVSKLSNALKLQKAYETRCKEAEQAELALEAASISNGAGSNKDLNRLEEQLRKERKRAGIAALDYKSAIEQYERIRIRWQEDMTAACWDFQQAEEERIDFIKNILQAYRHAQKEAHEQCIQSAEMVENSIDAVCKDVDIEMFVKTQFTGNEKPIALEFKAHGSFF